MRVCIETGGSEVLAVPPGGAVHSEVENVGLLRRGWIIYPLNKLFIVNLFYVRQFQTD